MAITRRQFIKRTGLATAGTVFGSSLFNSPLVRRAFADTIGGRYLIVLFLDGGNDGLNTVPPSDNGTSGALRDAYEDNRSAGVGGLRLLTGSLSGTPVGLDAHTGTPISLHPGLSGLWNLTRPALYGANRLAVIQGCGYPEYNLSHDVARDIWMTGSPLSSSPTGWVGRHIADEYNGANIPGICIDGSISLDFAQTGTNVLAIRTLSNFSFPYDGNHNSDNNAKKTAYQALYGASQGELQERALHVGNVGGVTLGATDNYPSLDDNWDAPQDIRDGYDALGSDTADRFREISKIIRGIENGAPGVDSHFFRLTTGNDGSFDTHSEQGTDGANENHFQIHQAWGDAVRHFYDDMVDKGVADKVLIVVWSEFSRRISQNDSGTDHGSQGPMFVIGGGVNGGLYGNHPDINNLDNDGNTTYNQSANPDPYVSTDFRDVFGTILKHWVNMAQVDVQALFPLDGIGNATDYWHASHFDLGFLP